MKFSYEHPSDLHALRTYLYDSFDWRYRGKSIPPPGLHLLSAARMIFSQSQLWKCDGHVSGEGFRGLHFDMHEVFAQEVEQTQSEGVLPLASDFKGLLIALRHKTSFLSRTIVKHDFGPLNTKTVDGMNRVGLLDSAFEARFEVYSDDQVESRALLTPDFMERLLEMDRNPRYANIQIGFVAGKMYIALPLGTRARFGSDVTHMTPKQAAAQVIAEMQTVFEILGDADVLQASAGRKTDAAIQIERQAWYDERVSTVENYVTAAVEAGILSGAPMSKWVTEDAYDLIDPMLHGMLHPRF